MGKIFTDGVKTPFSSLVKEYEFTTKKGEKKKFGYVPWALAYALADRPLQRIVDPDGKKCMEVFGGVAVGIRERVPGTDFDQVTWLPVLDRSNRSVPMAKATSRDISDTINRCRAKAVAMVNGVCLSLYAHGEHNTVKFIKKLDVKPSSDLSQAKAVTRSVEEKNGTFIDWPYALAAARITDPAFHWEVEFQEVIDRTTGEVAMRPYCRLGTGYGVAVTAVYAGNTHTELLPIMGFVEVQTKNGKKLLDHQPLANPTCHDWNRTVMRCLTKAIAMVSGYGLNVYAKTEVEATHVEPLQRSEPAATPAPADTAAQASVKDAPADAPASASPSASAPARAPAPAPAPDSIEAIERKQELISNIQRRLIAAKKDASALLVWLGHADTNDLGVASLDELERGLLALTPRGEAAAH